jgi:uncharacterized OsmC-like protein
MEDAPILIEHVAEDRFHIQVRDHGLLIDQPFEAGGDNQGPTPSELFVASLAGCVGFFAERFLRRHGLPVRGLSIEANFRFATKPSRIDAIDIRMTMPAAIPAELRQRLLRVAERCTVHNSILSPPTIRITETEPERLRPVMGGD